MNENYATRPMPAGEGVREGILRGLYHLLHPDETPRTSYVEQCLGERQGPVIATTDYIRTLPDLIRPFVPAPYSVLGTDGFGRSDTRQALRHFFEVDRHYIVVAALKALADQGEIAAAEVKRAIEAFNIDPDRPAPVTV
jgi:pyruvate dehydrogenase E1 component